MLYIASYALKYHTMMRVSKKIDEIDATFWSNLVGLSQNQTVLQDYYNEVFYLLNSGIVFSRKPKKM